MAKKQKIVIDTETNWEQIPIEFMVQEISNDFVDPEYVKQQVAKLEVKFIGLLQDYTVENLKDKGIVTSVATAIVQFISKYKGVFHIF